jgi:excisionase family DNA binding protein
VAAEERFLSTEEVAERLQVDEQTVRRWIKSGKLEAVKPGREWRIPPTAFEALLESYSSPKAPRRPSPKAPDSGDEERRAKVEEYDALFRDIYGLLKEYAETSQTVGDSDKIATLLAIISFTNAGLLRFIKDELDPQNGSELAAMHSAVLRLNILQEDLEKAWEYARGDIPDTVVYLSEYHNRRAAS